MKSRSSNTQFLDVAAAVLALAVPAVPALADPPPHAPAHGYRYHQYQGHDLVFDSELGVYVVSDLEHHYFLDGLFFLWTDGNWRVSSRLDGDWKHPAPGAIPPALTGKYRNQPGHKGSKAKGR